jgi:hypothetical protein
MVVLVGGQWKLKLTSLDGERRPGYPSVDVALVSFVSPGMICRSAVSVCLSDLAKALSRWGSGYARISA